MPRSLRSTRPFFMSVADFMMAAMTGLAVSIGMAKFRFWPPPRVLMPITYPFRSTSGPPLLPGLIGVSICIQLEKSPVSRFSCWVMSMVIRSG